MKRIEVTVQNHDAVLIRKLAAALRRNDASARKVRMVMRDTVKQQREPTIAEVIDSLPDISGPEFDAVFEEIERFRHHPVMTQVRDVDL
jgi:hypothetical protein